MGYEHFLIINHIMDARNYSNNVIFIKKRKHNRLLTYSLTFLVLTALYDA